MVTKESNHQAFQGIEANINRIKVGGAAYPTKPPRLQIFVKILASLGKKQPTETAWYL